MHRTITGAIAGTVATVPMTLVMVALHRCLPRKEQYPLPPRQVTMRAVEEAEVSSELNETGRRTLTTLAHFGMGTAMGACYGLADRDRQINGLALGTIVWIGNYLGLLPALGLLSRATRHPPRRNGLMIVAHWVWGITAVAAFQAMHCPSRGSDALE